jgi:hypothetical protein
MMNFSETSGNVPMMKQTFKDVSLKYQISDCRL